MHQDRLHHKLFQKQLNFQKEPFSKSCLVTGTIHIPYCSLATPQKWPTPLLPAEGTLSLGVSGSHGVPTCPCVLEFPLLN